MNPRCVECGNETRFLHEIEGSELRVYDDDGLAQTQDVEITETRGAQCADCGSEKIDFDDDS